MQMRWPEAMELTSWTLPPSAPVGRDKSTGGEVLCKRKAGFSIILLPSYSMDRPFKPTLAFQQRKVVEIGSVDENGFAAEGPCMDLGLGCREEQILCSMQLGGGEH